MAQPNGNGSRKLSKIVSRPKRSGKIWVMAVDPFNDKEIASLWNLVEPLAQKLNAQVQAAYVLAPASLNWTGDFSGPWMKKYVPIAEAKMENVLPHEAIKKVIIPCHESGQRPAVKAFISYAQRAGANCIVISTHARK